MGFRVRSEFEKRVRSSSEQERHRDKKTKRMMGGSTEEGNFYQKVGSRSVAPSTRTTIAFARSSRQFQSGAAQALCKSAAQPHSHTNGHVAACRGVRAPLWCEIVHTRQESENDVSRWLFVSRACFQRSAQVADGAGLRQAQRTLYFWRCGWPKWVPMGWFLHRSRRRVEDVVP